MGKIVSVNVSRKKGTVKKPAPEIELLVGRGVARDAHAGPGDRQVSLLMQESIERQERRMRENGRPETILKPGMFAENLTTQGVDLLGLKLGDELRVGKSIRLRVTKIGKECHTKCAIYVQVGECVMPTEGIFCEVLAGGKVQAGDAIERL